MVIYLAVPPVVGCGQVIFKTCHPVILVAGKGFVILCVHNLLVNQESCHARPAENQSLEGSHHVVGSVNIIIFSRLDVHYPDPPPVAKISAKPCTCLDRIVETYPS